MTCPGSDIMHNISSESRPTVSTVLSGQFPCSSLTRQRSASCSALQIHDRTEAWRHRGRRLSYTSAQVGSSRKQTAGGAKYFHLYLKTKDLCDLQLVCHRCTSFHSDIKKSQHQINVTFLDHLTRSVTCQHCILPLLPVLCTVLHR